MRRQFFWACLAALAGVLTLGGCAGRGSQLVDPVAAGERSSGLYRVTVQDPIEGQRRFRLLLFAELPDRIHGEILSPVGSVVMIFDGGGDRMAVTFVRDRVAFAGPASEEALERVLGIRLSLAGLVQGLLTGEVSTEGLTVVREADESPALPTRLELRRGPRSMTLELKRLQPLRAAASGLGRGQPAEGLDVRPLSELRLYDPVDDPGDVGVMDDDENGSRTHSGGNGP